jgi:nucleotide-binding universal stress UspA family protein
MAIKVIVSYDGTANDRDALALGRLFAEIDADVALAYVRHTQESEEARERLEDHEAHALLEGGARSLGRDVERHVVLSASTGEGLWALAEREGADVVVFGSDYRTPVGGVRPGNSASRLLDGGPAAIALAPAGLRERAAVEVTSIGVIPEGADAHTDETARALASKLGATIAASTDEAIDLLVVGSRPEAPEGRVMVSAATEYAIENAACPVLVVPRGVTVPFASPAPLTA